MVFVKEEGSFLQFFFFSESVKSLLGKQFKILLKNVVRLETKGDKTENRVLVSCRSVNS